MKNKTLIIAEAGVNHNGDIGVAKKLVLVAKECGADIVKFQTFNVKGMVSKYAEMAEYQKKNMNGIRSQKDMLSKLVLSEKDFMLLADFCGQIGIQFMSTPFDIDSLRFLNSLQDIWKIPSGEITNYPYLVEIAKTGKKIILSTGMSTLKEIEAALNVLKNYGAGEVILLHCTTDYPAKFSDVNLKAMIKMKKYFGCEVGYSDHTQGMEIAVAAVAMGAKVIEKHFTLDKNMEGPDHRASIEPTELSRLIKSVRNVEKALGNGIKVPSESEKSNLKIVRKSIIAAKDIKAGEDFTEKNLTTKRPGTGISPMRWNEIIGLKAKRNFTEDELIEV